jgi:hypothetical protein
MNPSTKSKLAILMGIIIGIADIYWAYTSYYYVSWLMLAIIIFIADLIWLWIDMSFMKMKKR